jgi:phage shock protein PspC (stress-responsive transcriptional regulator)
MKETVKVNLGQRLFDFDFDAYEALKNYLDSLKRYFEKSPAEADEILQDIEQRMADLLEEKAGSLKNSVTLRDITGIISMMGTTEDFEPETDTENNDVPPTNDEKKTFSGTYDKSHRRLYRDIDHNILGGVCRGIAAYFNIDPVWVRLIWVLLFCVKGVGIIAYLIMWIIVPAARSTAQKLEMSGRPVNLENIKDAVKKEFKKVEENFDNFHGSEAYRRTQSTFAEIFTVLGRVVLVFLKVFLVIFGVVMAFIGIGLLFGIVTISSFGLHHFYFPQLPYSYYYHPYLQISVLFLIAMALVIMIPVFSLLAGLIRIVFNVRTYHSVASGFAWIIWTLAFVFVIFTFTSGGQKLSHRYESVNKNRLSTSHGKILSVSFQDENEKKNNLALFHFFGKELIHNQQEKKYYLHPNVFIESSNDSDFYLKIERSLSIRGADKDYELDKLEYAWSENNNGLVLDTYFDVDDDEIWQIPGMRLTLLVPDGAKIRINHKKKTPFSHECDISGKFPNDYYNKVLIMKDGELQTGD